MARNIHWKVSFRTRSEKLGVLNLYEENYSGAVVELTPAAVPFETQEDSADTWFVPIRKQTGYIRVLDEGNTDGIMPVGMKDRYVEYTEDGTLKWCGYVVPDVFSSDWDAVDNEIEFPVIGGIGVLEGEYLNEDDGLGVVPLSKLMYDCLLATGINYERIYIPTEVFPYEGSLDDLYPLTVEVSRFNFFKDNDTLNSDDTDWTRYNGATCYDVLSEIMKLWGWTLRERGKDLWITSPKIEKSSYISFAKLGYMAEGQKMLGDGVKNSTEYEISSLELAGSDHKRDVLQGRKKVIVKAAVNPVGAVVPSVDKAKMNYVDSFVNEFATNGQTYAYEKFSLYVPKRGYTDVEFRTYVKTGMNTLYDDWTSVSQTMEAISLYVGAYFIEQERVTAEEYEKKKNWNLSETIRINLQDWTGEFPTVEKARELPIVIMKSRNVANYVSGAFVISAQTRSISKGFLTDYDGNGKGTLEIRFRVGDKCWNGSSWVSGSEWFTVDMGNEEEPNSTQGTGKIISTKTLDMPYTGADGYVMPIDQSLSGEIELTIHAVRNDGGYGVLMLDNFKVDYFGEDQDQRKSDDSENRYAKQTGLSYNSEEEISLQMATNNNNKAGYGILSLDGANVETMYFSGTDQTERPEMNLVSKGVQLYGRNTEKLTLQLEVIGANPHDLLTRNGKKYVLASEAVNWQEETGQYIIMEV